MNKVLLIIEREFLNRVGKKSFLVATILIPLIFPAIIGVLAYVAKKSHEGEQKDVIYFVDETNEFKPDTSRFLFKKFDGPLDEARKAYQETDDLGLLYIPNINLNDPKGITLYTVKAPTLDDENAIERIVETQISDAKMSRLKVSKGFMDSLKTNINLNTLSVGADGVEKASNTGMLYGVGMGAGILMYMFIFIYGAQIMQGIIEEKTSKVVEVIVSSVRPFQLMLGKILGLASVGLLQFVIWIVLMTTLTVLSLKFAGITPQQSAMQEMSSEVAAQQAAGGSAAMEMLTNFMSLNWSFIIFCFLFYFLGGYLLYGALFAAVGSSVDSPAEAQQFMFPITIPMLISYMSLFMFILREPHSAISVWLSIIPFTSPIAMMGRVGSDVPMWQLILSMVLLIGGFVFTTWVAGRIYRVGILMSGTKVNYKVLAKWFLMKG